MPYILLQEYAEKARRHERNFANRIWSIDCLTTNYKTLFGFTEAAWPLD
jgi:hypothetical protein